MSEPVVPRLAVIGCGLIGSSVVRAARQNKAAGEIVVFDASVDTSRAGARARPSPIPLSTTAVEAATGADLVIFATPPAVIGEAVTAAATGLKPGAIVSDVGSVKARGRRGDGRGRAARRLRRPRPPDRRHRALRPRRRLRHAVPEPLDDHLPAWNRTTPPMRAAVERLTRVLARARRQRRDRWTPATTTWCWPSPPTCHT